MTTRTSIAVETEGLERHFGDQEAVAGYDLSVAEGEICEGHRPAGRLGRGHAVGHLRLPIGAALRGRVCRG